MKKKLSRQRMDQKSNIDNGMCVYHKNRPILRSQFCAECFAKYTKKRGIIKHSPTKDEWNSVDWSKPDWEIIRDLNVGKAIIQIRRKAMLAAHGGKP